METYKFSKNELDDIKLNGFDEKTISEQIKKIKRGVSFTVLDRPARLDDGVVKFSSDDEEMYISNYEIEKENVKIIKFVPASGAASRMFSDLLSFYKGENKKSSYVDDFFKGLYKGEFAFTDEIRQLMKSDGHNLIENIESGNYKLILDYVLNKKGLNYANLPKAVIRFHSNDNEKFTPIDEHIAEAIEYARGKNGEINIHFTISREFENLFLKEITASIQRLNIDKEKINITISEQKSRTNTVSLDENLNLFKTEKGKILFRPGGHGSLIENLNDLDGDIIFIKNIDNVIIRKLFNTTNRYKKILAGVLLDVRNRVYEYLKFFEEEQMNEKKFNEVKKYCEERLFFNFKDEFELLSSNEKFENLRNRLNRPIRVCGMVKNEGEPGGGPFWVNKNGELSLQIVEGASVNRSIESQKEIFENSDFFNPVDIVCSIKDFKGRKFDLKNFIDDNSFFISEKTYKGKKLKALELPGLWNGAMSDWLTVFVQVPLLTFNPVKKINDLLSENHQ